MGEIDYKSAYEMVLDANKTIYKENKRLNNIITELEKWLEEKKKKSSEFYHKYDDEDLKDYSLGKYYVFKDTLDKLQELKGSDKE